jgi:hypothetical protein
MLSRVGGCVTYRLVLDWIIRYIDTVHTPLGSTGNYSAVAIPTLCRSPLHTPVSSVNYTLH